MIRWHFPPEGYDCRLDRNFTWVAFRIAACSLSAVTASGKTVMVPGVAPLTGMTMIPGVPVSTNSSAWLLFFSRDAVWSPRAEAASPAFDTAARISSAVSLPSLWPVV
ncbi:hypothetical protein HEL88_023655 [Escherichia coli]|nr:hypothetical protein [Escherichia coli]